MNARLIEARKRRGLSIAALAAESGVPPHVIRHAERGGEPREDSALKIAEYLGVDVLEIWPVEDAAA